MRALALDVGSKTIGVAITDEARIAAHPLTVLARAGQSGDAQAVLAIVREHAVTDIVVGVPYELSGKLGRRAKLVQVFVAALTRALADGGVGGVAMHEQDERFTTAQAERVLLEADVSRRKRKGVIDQQAAALILQAWLDVRRPRE